MAIYNYFVQRQGAENARRRVERAERTFFGPGHEKPFAAAHRTGGEVALGPWEHLIYQDIMWISWGYYIYLIIHIYIYLLGDIFN